MQRLSAKNLSILIFLDAPRLPPLRHCRHNQLRFCDKYKRSKQQLPQGRQAAGGVK
jgi:hypothetical protein